MKSMTGFGRAIVNGENWDASIDISSVNRKGLEIFCALPRDFQSAERLVSNRVKEFYTRGKVSVSIRINLKKDAGAFALNNDAIAPALASLQNSCTRFGADFKLDARLIFDLNKELSYTNVDTAFDWQPYWEKLDLAVCEALQACSEMRKIEGDALVKDFSLRLALLRQFVEEINQQSSSTVLNYRDALLARLKSLNLELDTSDERLLKELSLFADKCDICEEITRLQSHISQFQDCILSDENCGRKLDFICQEVGREINTIGSKSNNIELTKIVIAFKNELERIREQAQNIE